MRRRAKQEAKRWTKHWTRPFTLLFASSLLLGACQPPTLQSGQLRFRFRVPQSSSYSAGLFKIAFIPPETERFEIEITGRGLRTARREVIDIEAPGTSETRTISELPIGQKSVSVKALQGERVLAEGQTEVLILPRRSVEAELELRPTGTTTPESPSDTLNDIVFRLGRALPIPLRVGLSISGEGLDSPQQEVFELAAGRTEQSLKDLPAGSKTAQISISANVQGEQIQADPQRLTFEVNANGGAQIELELEDFLTGFGDQLGTLLQRLSPAQLVSLVSGIDSARLTRIFPRLPADVQRLIRNNPILRALLNATVLNPETEETESSGGLSSEDLLSSVRFASLEPLDSLSSLAGRSDAAPELSEAPISPRVQTLKSQSGNTIQRGFGWGLVIVNRLPETLTSARLDYTVRITRLSLPRGPVFDSQGELTQIVKFNNRSFVAGLVPFNSGELLELQTGLYNISVSVRDTNSGAEKQNNYPILIPDDAIPVSEAQ